MRIFVVLIASVLFAPVAIAQDGYGSTSVYDRNVQLPKGKHFYVVPPNAVWDQQPWKDSVYRFPSFQEGKLEMDNGYTPSFRPMLNFNFFTGSIQILAPDGSTTNLKQSAEIKVIWIGSHKFVYDASLGYLEILLDGTVSVAQRTVVDGIYELTNGFKYSLNRAEMYKSPPIKETRYYWIEEQYFLLDENQKPFRATKNVLPKLLSKVKTEIKEYSSANNIDYNKKEDLVKITAYANGQASAN
jgi:hypothetical protein